MSYSVTVDTERYTTDGGGVRVKLALPVLATDNTAYLKRFTAYYKGLKEGFTEFAEGVLKKAAAGKEGAVYGAAINTVVCHENSRILSVYIEAAVTDGDGSRFYRLPQLWDKESGGLINPKKLFLGKKRHITAALQEAVTAKMKSGISVYSDAADLVKSRFKMERLYISPLGLVFFYHGGTLSDRPEPFSVPLSAEAAADFLRDGVSNMLWEK